MPFKSDEERAGLKWVLRIAALAATLALFAGIGMFIRKGNVVGASVLVFATPVFAVALSWFWTGSLFATFEWAKRHVQGVEGAHRHEWYAFRGQRVRVFIDEQRRPWFALNEIAFLLGLAADGDGFRQYSPDEIGTPESASETYLSESGLRRAIKYSTHPAAPALDVWLERDVLRMLRKRFGQDGS
jgi:hypothetical protein